MKPPRSCSLLSGLQQLVFSSPTSFPPGAGKMPVRQPARRRRYLCRSVTVSEKEIYLTIYYSIGYVILITHDYKCRSFGIKPRRCYSADSGYLLLIGKDGQVILRTCRKQGAA